MNVAIIGSRKVQNFDPQLMEKALPENCTKIISGGAKGVDTLAESLAKGLGIAFLKIEPNYTEFGIRAPIIRNIEIVENADLVLAFWDFESRGTAHTIAECLKRQIPVRVYSLK